MSLHNLHSLLGPQGRVAAPSLLQLIGAGLVVVVCCMAQAAGASEPGSMIKSYDFVGDGATPTRNWLEQRLFQLKHHFRHDNKIALSQPGDAMHIQVKENAFGIIVHEEDIPNARHVRLEWGVSSFPEGASYEHGVDDEAVMVYIFFGHETFDSGSFLIPDSPYFIAFYLCKDGTDELEKPYKGNHFNKSGRYICVDHPNSNAAVVSEIDLVAEFKKSFGLDVVPPVSGISIEVDTTHADNDGRTAAFISSLSFFD